MLDHADRGDLVEASVEVAVVADLDLDPIGVTGLGDALAGALRLRLRQRHAEHLPGTAARGLDREAAPAAADVEHPVALADRELVGRQLELRPLGGLERRVALLPRDSGGREEGAAVGHRAVEEELEELVRDVVVMADGARVALLAVPAPLRDELGGRPRRRRRQAHRADGGQHQPQAARRIDRRRLPAVEQGDHGVHVVDLELARYVGATEAELAGGAQRMGDRLR